MEVLLHTFPRISFVQHISIDHEYFLNKVNFIIALKNVHRNIDDCFK